MSPIIAAPTRAIARRLVSAAAALALAAGATVALGTAAQAAFARGDGITVEPGVWRDGEVVDSGADLDPGATSHLVFVYENTGPDATALRVDSSAVDFESESFPFRGAAPSDPGYFVGTMTCTNPAVTTPAGGVLAPGETVTCVSGDFVVPDEPAEGGFSGTDSIGSRGASTWASTFPLQVAIMEIATSNGQVWFDDGTPASQVSAGQSIHYTFDVANTGAYDRDLSATDALGLDYVCEPMSMLVGESATCRSASHVVTAADEAAGSINNAASATGMAWFGISTTVDQHLPSVTVIAALPGPTTPPTAPPTTPTPTPTTSRNGTDSEPGGTQPTMQSPQPTATTNAASKTASLAQTGTDPWAVAGTAVLLLALGLTGAVWRARRTEPAVD